MLPVISQYRPTAPTLVREPFHRDGWVYEEKIDGWRISRTRPASASAWSAATDATTPAASATWRRRSRSCRRPANVVVANSTSHADGT
jgi:hypothetical protein